MAEIFVGGGDSVSRLVQLLASRSGVRLNWLGKGDQDIELLLADYMNKKLLNDCLWGGVKELAAMPELKELPEAVQAKIFSIVLKAQAVFELDIAEHRRKLNRPKPGPTEVA